MTTEPLPDPLKPYLDRVFALKSARERHLDAGDLQAIARDLGLSEADLQAVEASARAAHARGRGHLAHGRYDDAVAELSTASALLPTDLAVLEDHAEAHLARWKLEWQMDDRVASALLARRALELDPAWQRGFALLNELETPRKVPGIGSRIVGWILLLAALGGGVYLAATSNHPPRPAGVPRAAGAPGGAAATLPSEVEIPVVLVPNARAADLRLVPRYSRLNNYPERSFWKLAAELRNTGDMEIARVQARVTLVGAGEDPLFSYETELAGAQQPPLRPGDAVVFTAVRETMPGLREVRVTVLSRDETRAAAAYGASRPVPLRWRVTPPAHFALVVRERALPVSELPGQAESLAMPHLELHNRGAVIRSLKLTMHPRDAAGKPLGERPRQVVVGEGKELRPGEVRLDKWFARVPRGFASYELEVAEIQ